MTTRGRIAASLMLALSATGAVADAGPRLRATGGGVALERLPAVLDEPDVARQLTTGLTVVLAFRVAFDDATGGIDIELRYDLWDEVFAITVRQLGRAAVAHEPVAPEDLASWWRGLVLEVLVPAAPAAVGAQADVRLEVLPFSRAEEIETQRWLALTVRGEAESGASQSSRSAEGGDESLGSVVDILIATSVRRRAIRSFSWSVKVEE